MKLKVVYFGASLAGKSTNVRVLYEKLRSRGVTKGDYISMETDENRTLFVEMFLSSFSIEDQDIDVGPPGNRCRPEGTGLQSLRSAGCGAV